jgi:hypothetical protein
VLFIYLCRGFPIVVREEERHNHDHHQLVAAFGDPMVAWLTYAALREDALSQLRTAVRPAAGHAAAPARRRPGRRASDHPARPADGNIASS